jgi:hypothetical protein
LFECCNVSSESQSKTLKVAAVGTVADLPVLAHLQDEGGAYEEHGGHATTLNARGFQIALGFVMTVAQW